MSDPNPYEFRDALGLDAEYRSSCRSLSKCTDYLGAQRAWMRASFFLTVFAVFQWVALALASVILNWSRQVWNPAPAIGAIVGVAVLCGVLVSGCWLLKTTSRIHRAVEEQTLSSIADVLEAQRSFWRALGILVLLAIAAIVVAATFPAWSVLFS